MLSKEPSEGVSPPAPSQAARPSASRRRWLRAGAGAAPVLLSFASKPVYAATSNCLSASANLSANTSRTVFQICSANGPTTWRTTPRASWPAGTTSLAFSSVFGLPTYKTTAHANPTFYQVLTETAASPITADQQTLARWLCALYLSLKKDASVVPLLVLPGGIDDVIALWNTAANSNFYPRGSATAWGPARTSQWLSTLCATH